MLDTIINQHISAIKDTADQALVGAALHDIFLDLMLASADEQIEPVRKAAQQEVLAKALRAVKQYAQKPRTLTRKPVRAMPSAPTTPT